MERGSSNLSPLVELTGLQNSVAGKFESFLSKGLSYSQTPAALIPPFDKLVALDNPSRTVETINELRRQHNLPENIPDGYEPPVGAEIAAHWSKRIGELPQARLGGKWVEAGDHLTVDVSGDISDAAAAEESTTQQLHEGVRRKAISFADVAKRLDNQVGWNGIASASRRFADGVQCETKDIPKKIGAVYDATIELGSFLDLDRRLQQDRTSSANPLDQDVRRAFTDLMRTAAPWVRRFPTARELDDEAGSFLTRHELYEPSGQIVTEAARTEVISENDAELLRALLAAANRGEFQGQKAGARGYQSTRNLLIAGLSAVAVFYSGAVSSDFATKSKLVQRVGTLLATHEEAAIKVMK